MRSFYLKLAIVFTLILVIFAGIIAYTTINASKNVTQETIQKVNYNLAENLAKEIEPLLTEEIDMVAVEEKLYQLSGTNPQFDLYLLNRQGLIKGYSGHSNSENQPIQNIVDTHPIDRFLAGNNLPILGTNPLNQNRKTPFSASNISIVGSNDCYLYVVLEGGNYLQEASLLSDNYITRNALLMIGIILTFSVLTGLFLFRLLTNRMTTISQVVTDFERGQLQKRIPVRGNDELTDLSNSFNQMADSLVESMNEIKKSDKLRRELVANVSHDLRSPLSSIQGYLETIQLKGDKLSKKQFEEYFKVVLGNTRKLNRMIDDLFELSKLDAENVKPDLQYISMAELVQDLFLQFKPIADEKNITLDVDFPENPTALVYADISLMDRALSNLIDNAIKHTPKGGYVSINSTKNGKDVVVEIKDTGMGIPEEDLPHIFDRFYQVDKSRSNVKGAGLGLSIAQKILELHGARVSVDSLANRGTTFKIMIPAF